MQIFNIYHVIFFLISIGGFWEECRSAQTSQQKHFLQVLLDSINQKDESERFGLRLFVENSLLSRKGVFASKYWIIRQSIFKQQCIF